MTTLVFVEHDRGTMSSATFEALAAARTIGGDVHAVSIGDAADGLDVELGSHGVAHVHQVHHESMLSDYGPEAWGAALHQVVAAAQPAVVLACGTDRGNEVMAQLAARLDVALVANCLAFEPGSPWTVTRVRWGGSLLEQASLDASIALFTVAHHAFEGAAVGGELPSSSVVDADLDPSLARSMVRTRVERQAGVTLATAPVVVSGGRGVGSAEAFGPLEELAGILGGVVGCSRAVTNNGWRNHTDQVGQTGTRIAPDIYIACGISGAIQHWVGAMASKKILAINTDKEANMVVKADYAVIGDLHKVVPAISAEIRRRRS